MWKLGTLALLKMEKPSTRKKLQAAFHRIHKNVDKEFTWARPPRGTICEGIEWPPPRLHQPQAADRRCLHGDRHFVPSCAGLPHSIDWMNKQRCEDCRYTSLKPYAGLTLLFVTLRRNSVCSRRRTAKTKSSRRCREPKIQWFCEQQCNLLTGLSLGRSPIPATSARLPPWLSSWQSSNLWTGPTSSS